MITMALPPLPPGYTYATPPVLPQPPKPAPPPRAETGPLLSGAIATVTTADGHDATIHRADYTVTDHLGEYLQHGYGWRCTICSHTATGYAPVDGFTAARADARTHLCEVAL